MERIIEQGRMIFAVVVIALGIEHLVCAHFPGAVVPVIPWVPAHAALAYLTGTALIAAGASIVANVQTRRVAALLGVFYLVCAMVLQVPKAVAHPLDIGIRTGVFEVLAMAGGALTLARTAAWEQQYLQPWAGRLDVLLKSGRYIFAVCCIVFGVDHFFVLRFLTTLIPPWFPGGLFWAAFTGAALIAAGLSMAVKWMDRWGSGWLGAMFLIWFLFLHVPRLTTSPRSHNPDEWSSAFIALAMCGACWIIACDSAVSRPGAAMWTAVRRGARLADNDRRQMEPK